MKLEAARPLRVLPLDNTQSHALTCSKKRGSVGHHFRVLGDGSDELRPNLDATLAALRRFEWVGITYVQWSRGVRGVGRMGGCWGLPKKGSHYPARGNMLSAAVPSRLCSIAMPVRTGT